MPSLYFHLRWFVAGLFIVAPLGAQEAPALKTHWWWSRASMAEKILPRARDFDVDTIVLENDVDNTDWGDITSNLCDYSFTQDLLARGEQLKLVQTLREHYTRIIATARTYGVRTFIMCPEVHAPKAFGPLDYDDPRVWKLVSDRLQNVFQALPSLDGYVLYLTEGPMIDVEFMKGSEPSKAKRARKLIDACWAGCHAERRQFVVTTFIHNRPMLDAIAEALRGFPPDPDFAVLQYCCPNDWGLYSLINSSIGHVGPHPEILGFDCCAENWGKSAHPFIQSAFMAQRLRKARQTSRTVVGIAGYAAWTDHTAIGTLNEANIYTCQALMHRPDRDGNEILREWCARRFGEKAADVAAGCLGRTQQAVFKMEHVFGYWVDTTNKSGLPTLDEMDHYFIADFFGEALTKWDPDPQLKATWDGINHPTQAFLEKVLSEKDKARQLTEMSLSELRDSKDLFKPDGFLVLQRGFIFQELWSRLWRSQMQAFFLRQIGRRDGWSLEIRKNLTATLEEYSRQADELEQRFGKDVFPAGPARARAVIQAIRKEVPQ